MAALLTSVFDSGKVAGYIGECDRLHIPVLPPSVNESVSAFTVAGDHIRFGLLAVKNLGRGLITELVKEREENGPFRSFYDFCRRMTLYREFNRRALESLIKCGSLDGLGANRRQMLESSDTVLQILDDQNRRNLAGQLGFFDDPDNAAMGEPVLPELPEAPYDELLAMEKEVSGMYLTGNPMKPYTALHERMKAARTDRIAASFEEGMGEGPAEYADGDTVLLLGMLSSVHVKSTKSNAQMAYATLEDMAGSIELVIFPKALAQCGHLLQAGRVVVARGRINVREDEDPKILVSRLDEAPPPDALPRPIPGLSGNPSPPAAPSAAPVRAPDGRRLPSARHGLYLRVPSSESPEWKRAQLVVRVFDGEEPLYLRYADSGKLVRAPHALWVNVNDVMIGELRAILGKENVAVVD